MNFEIEPEPAKTPIDTGLSDTSLGLQSRAHNLLGFDNVVHSLGGGYRELFQQVGLDPNLLQRPEDLFPFVRFNQLLNLAAETLDCAHIGILLGLEHTLKAPMDTHAQLMRRSPNLAAANEMSHRYRTLSSEVTFWRMEVSGKLASVYRYNETPFQFDYRQHRFFNVTRAFSLGAKLLQEQWRPHSIHFAFAKPGPADYQKLLGAPVFFDADTDFYCFPAEDLYKPLPSYDDDLLVILQNHAEELKHKFQFGESMISVVRKLISQSLASNQAKLGFIAALLQMHPRALQRQLLAEGISFKDLVNKTRMDIAQDFLARSDISLTHIADVLGYSELSAFSRGFRNNTGLSPEQWRRLQK